MMRALYGFVLLLCLAGWAAAQVDQLPSSDKGPGAGEAPPRYEHDASVSSSRDTRIDISPPKDDSKNHPKSDTAAADAEASDDVHEMHPWDPHKANKDVEVGDFYFKRKNYSAAVSRYQEALLYKPDDAVANFRLGECFEKLDDPDEAVAHFEEYLKILPRGPLAESAQKSLRKLKADKAQASSVVQTK